jgi:hypothetical protein
MTATRKDAVKKLLAKGNLSGLEAAKVILAELWENEHARDPILSETEQATIKSRLTNPAEISVYNDWIGAFPTICEVNYIAHIMFLSLQRSFTNLANLFNGFIITAIINLKARLTPTIVTEKQLGDLRAEQRKNFFSRKHSLGVILCERAKQMVASEGLALEDLLLESLRRVVHFYRLACTEIRQLIESGHFKITHTQRVLTLLKRLETSKPDSELLAIVDTTLSQEPTHRMEQPEPLLEKVYATGEVLFGTGLPEWVEYENRYGDEYPSGFAVMTDPRQEDLDSKGHFRDLWGSLKDSVLHLVDEGVEEAFGHPQQEFLTLKLNRTKLEISHFLFCQTVLQEMAGTVAVPFSEEVDSWRSSLESSIEHYETTLRWAMELNPKAKKALAGIPVLEIDQLQPSAEARTLVRNRLMKPLDRAQWFQDCKEYYLKEALAMVPEGEVEGMLSGLGREARKRVHALLEAVNE